MISNLNFKSISKRIFLWGFAHLNHILLVAILFAAIGLRLWGIGFDLPNLYHPDEDALIMPAINMIKTGDLEPTRLEYGSLHIYLLAAVSAVVFVLSVRDRHISSVDQLMIYERGAYPAIYAHPEYYLASRVVSAFMGTGTVLLIYLLARRLGNERQGLIAAAIAAFMPAMVADAHFSTSDTPLVFWVALSLYLLIRVYDNWENNNLWAYAGAGFVCGLAVSTKYNGVILAVPLLATSLLRTKTIDDLVRIRFLIGPLGMAAGFLTGTPYALINLPKFLGWFGYSLQLYNANYEPRLSAWRWHLNYHMSDPHAAIILLGAIGFFVSFYYWRQRAIIINSFAIVLWFAILSQNFYQTRMWLPTAPIFVLWAALILYHLVRWLHGWFTTRKIPAYFAYLPLVILVYLAVMSGIYDRNFQSGDVRTQAATWIMQNIPPGTKVAGDYFVPNIDQAWPVTKVFFLYDKDVNWYKEQEIKYLVMNEALNDFDKMPTDALDRYHSLMEDVCLVEAISGSFLAVVDIDVNIYQVPPCN